jgi:hypothetical protein
MTADRQIEPIKLPLKYNMIDPTARDTIARQPYFVYIPVKGKRPGQGGSRDWLRLQHYRFELISGIYFLNGKEKTVLCTAGCIDSHITL